METIIIEKLLNQITQLTYSEAAAEAKFLTATELLKQKDKQIAELEALLEEMTKPDGGDE